MPGHGADALHERVCGGKPNSFTYRGCQRGLVHRVAIGDDGPFAGGRGEPRLRHPLFASRDFELATRNRFFLCLLGDDPAFEAQQARALLARLQPLACVEVAA